MKYIITYYPETNKIELQENTFGLSAKKIKHIYNVLRDVGIVCVYIGEL